MKVSVIVPNNGRDLTNLKKSVENSTYKDIELIIVDEGYERSKQRNIGYERSTGEYLLFLDSDMTVHPKFIQDCIEASEYYDGLYFDEIIVNHPIKTKFRNCYTKTRIDAIRFLKRKYFIPFDENITGFEDWSFDRMFKGRKGYGTYPIYHHANSDIRKKLFYYTRWLLRYIRKHPDSLLYELNPFYRLWLILKHL